MTTLDMIKAEKTTFMGVQVNKYSTALEIRSELVKRETSPKALWKGLQETWSLMSEGQKRAEYELINC